MPDPFETDDYEGQYEPEIDPYVHRDQTEPRDPSTYLRAQLEVLERQGRPKRGVEVLPASGVRAMVGQAVGALEALEDRGRQVSELQGEVEELKARLAEAEGGRDERALQLWRAGRMAEVQGAAERLYGDAQTHAQALVTDARRRAEDILTEARRRAAAMAQSPDGLPTRPDPLNDRVGDALSRTRYLEALRAWATEKLGAILDELDSVGSEVDEARAIARAAVGSAPPPAAKKPAR